MDTDDWEYRALLRAARTPDPPPWLRDRVMASVRAEAEQRQRRADRRHRAFTLAVLLALTLVRSQERLIAR